MVSGKRDTVLGLSILALMAFAASARGAVVDVSGGGAALQTAVDSSTAGDELLISDGLDYSPVSLGKTLSVRAADGQSPRVVSDPNVNDGSALRVFDGGRNSTWKGVHLIQNLPGGAGGHNVLVVFDNADEATFTIQDCDISVDVPGDSVDARVVGLGERTHMVNCRLKRTDNNGNPLIMLFDGAGDSVIENCTFGPSEDATAIVNIARAGGTLTVRNCLFTGLQRGGRGITATDRPQTYNLSDCVFDTGVFALFAGNGSSSPGTVFNIDRCRMGPKNNDWTIFAGDGSGVEFHFRNCVFFAEDREIPGYLGSKNHTMEFLHCTFADAPGYTGNRARRWFFMEGANAAASSFTVRNCLLSSPRSDVSLFFNNPGGALAIPPVVTAGVNLVNAAAHNDADSFKGAGTPIAGEAGLAADGYHLLESSPAVDAGEDLGIATDVDGCLRPRGASPDLGADETSGSLLVTGGGDALQSAINSTAGGACDPRVIVVMDSLDYSPVLLGKALCIEAAEGESPRVVSDPNVNDGSALRVFDGGRNSTWKGVHLIQNLPGGAGGHNVLVVFDNADEATFTIQDCNISVDVPGDSVDARVVGLGERTHMVNCRLKRTDNNGNPLIMLFDGAGDSVIENCTFGPSEDATAIVNIARAGGTLTVRNCLFTGLQRGGRGITATDRPQTYNLSDCVFDTGVFALFAGNGSSSPGTVFNIDRCRMGPKNNDWTIFAGDGSGVEFHFRNCVFFAEDREIPGYLGSKNHTMEFLHCTFADAPGYTGNRARRWFFMEGANAAASSFTVRNCLLSSPRSDVSLFFNNPGGALAIPPVVTAGVNLVNAASHNDADSFKGAGTQVAGDPQFAPDGYHLLGNSDAIDQAEAGQAAVDIDGAPRPGATEPESGGFDLGADEFTGTLIPEGGGQLPGDCNQDATLDLSDAICLLGNLFLGTPAVLPCEGGEVSSPGNVALLNVNGDELGVDVSDAVYLLNFLFLGGAEPSLGMGCVAIAGCPQACTP